MAQCYFFGSQSTAIHLQQMSTEPQHQKFYAYPSNICLDLIKGHDT
jgi:hypothetical protein